MPPIVVGVAGIAVTVALHAVATSFLFFTFTHFGSEPARFHKTRAKAFVLGLIASALAVKHYLDIILWAIAYWLLVEGDTFDNFETAVYFSSVTYTALGYGDIVISGPWRVLCGIQAMNGILLFGWSTALLIMLVQYFWFHQEIEEQEETRSQK